ncbi:hypothetical protein GIB67_001608 [Kingdonia uniflora]|uniref:EF-hand domain-containing protein n=1 Tax=Kingdonia uniflora TaxID=39325 RepID=A0A7J7L0T3_9MAGN|nr:hypothetical protein GIB67_001608 [Kingdonia uniflora]
MYPVLNRNLQSSTQTWINILLTEEELRPIVKHLYPGEISYAKYYAKYLFHEADDDRDGELTLEEMLGHQHVFCSTVVHESESDSDYGDFNDEF